MPAAYRRGTFLKFCFSVLLILSLFACNHLKRKYIIPQNKFVDVLVDIHLADAIALNNAPQYSGYQFDSANLYGSVFEKHGVNRAQFDSTINYYGSRPEEFQQIYNRVTSKLNIMMEEPLLPVETDQPALADEIIWDETGIHALPEMGDTNRVEISVPVKATGVYTVTTEIKIYTDDESEEPRMTLYYWYDNGSALGYREMFPEIQLKKDGNQNTYQTTRTLTNTQITHIKGYILNHSNTDISFQKHALVSEINVTYRQ